MSKHHLTAALREMETQTLNLVSTEFRGKSLILLYHILRLTFLSVIYKWPSVFLDSVIIYLDYSCDCHSNNTLAST